MLEPPASLVARTLSSRPMGCFARRGCIYRPPTAPPSSPIVVLGPGLPGVRRTRPDGFAAHLAGSGFCALVFDYRGFGDSEGEPRQMVRIRAQLADWHAACERPGRSRAVEGAAPARIGCEVGRSRVATSCGWRGRPGCRRRCVNSAAVQRHLVVPGHSSGALAAAPTRPCRSRRQGSTSPPATAPIRACSRPAGPARRPDHSARRCRLSPHLTSRLGRPRGRAVALGLLAYRPGRVTSRTRCPVFVAVGDQDEITPPGPAVRHVGPGPEP